MFAWVSPRENGASVARDDLDSRFWRVLKVCVRCLQACRISASSGLRPQAKKGCCWNGYALSLKKKKKKKYYTWSRAENLCRVSTMGVLDKAHSLCLRATDISPRLNISFEFILHLFPTIETQPRRLQRRFSLRERNPIDKNDTGRRAVMLDFLTANVWMFGVVKV